MAYFCQGKNAVFFTCTQTEDENQLQNFSNKLFSFDLPQKRYIWQFQNWEQAFISLKDIPHENSRKNIVVIDEFLYMVRQNPEIPTILQKLWDTELKNRNLMIILCGSSMSYSEKDILSDKNLLYGRATGIYKMLSMPYADSIEFFKSWTSRDKIIVYSILGACRII